MTTVSTYRVVVWGDSIAAGGWPELAERAFNVSLNTGRALQVINQGVGGMPAAMARRQFNEAIRPHQADLVVIQFGFNDVRHDGSRGALPLSTPEEFREHLTDMVRCCKNLGASVLVLGNHRTRRPTVLPTGLTYDEAREQYSRISAEVAKQEAVAFIDMAQATVSAGAHFGELVSEDGVHLSPTGNHHYAAIVASAIRRIMDQRESSR